MANSNATGAKIRRQEQRLAARMARRFAPAQTERSAAVVGHNLVAIDGQVYPAEGVDGAGALARVVNVGTPAVARYAPAQRTSVVATGGTGIGGGGTSGGGGTYFAGTGLTLDGSGYFHVNVSGLADATRGIGNFSNKFGIRLDPLTGGLEFTLDGYIQIRDELAGDGLDMLTGKIMAISDSLAGAGLQMGAGKILTLDPAVAGDGLSIDPVTKIMAINLALHSGLDTTADALHVGESAPIAYGSTWTQTANKSGAVHGHPVTSSATPGQTATLLNTDATGKLTLRRGVIDTNYLWGVNGARLWWNDTAEPDASATVKLRAASVSSNDSTLILKQITGQLGRLFKIVRDDGQELIIIRNDGTLESGNPPFISGARGWQLRPIGDAEFNNVWVRGELHASVFVVGETHAVGGTLLIATASKLAEEETIGAGNLKVNTTVVGVLGDIRRLKLNTEVVGNPGDIRRAAIQSAIGVLDVDDPPSGHASIFQVGEIVVIQTTYQSGLGGGITSGWFRVLGWEDMTTHFRYMVRRDGGTGDIFPAGTAVVSYGKAGDGRILLTSDKNYSPYQDVFITPADPWNGYDPLIRLGRLNGLPFPEIDINTPEFGLATMVNPSDTNAPYSIWSNRRALLKRINLELDNGTFKTVILESGGRVRMGTNAEVASTTGFDFDPATGNLLIGSKAEDHYLEWVQATGTLTVHGSLQIPTIPDPDWSDIENIPQHLAGVTGPAGLYVTGTELGYWNGSAWRSYINYLGHFRLAAASGSQGIIWDGTNLTINGAITVTGGNAATTAYADQAEADAKAYADGLTPGIMQNALTDANKRRVVGITGAIEPTADGGLVQWTSVTVRFADGSSKAVSGGSNSVGLWYGRRFLYVDATAAAPLTLQVTENLSSLSGNHALIAVIDKPALAGPPTVTTVAGGTYISGDSIITGSITANQIKAHTITGTEIIGDKISSIRSYTGSLNVDGALAVGANGIIHSAGKTTYTDGTPGFFLGYDGGVYRFDVGDADNYLRWSGSQLLIKVKEALSITNTAAVNQLKPIISASTGTAATGTIYHGTSTGRVEGFHISQSFMPYVDANSALGTPSYRWRELYISNFVETNELLTYGTADINGLLDFSGAIRGGGVSQLQNAVGGTAYGSFVADAPFSGTVYYFKWANLVLMFGNLSKTSSAAGLIKPASGVPAELRPQREIHAPAFWDGQKAATVRLETDGDLYSAGTQLGESGGFVFNFTYLT